MKNLIVLDIEVLPNYFLVAIKGLKSSKLLTLDMFGADARLTKQERSKLHSMLTKYTSFGFNSQRYDMPLINCALSGGSCEEIYKQSKNIIENNQPDFITYQKMGIDPRPYDHFDVSDPAPAVMISLKAYGTRVGSPRLQEFYLDPHKAITKDQVADLVDYCENDLDVTIDLYQAIEDRIDLRIQMSEQYGMDLRSKSDAQIAETVIASEIRKATKKTIRKPDFNPNYKPRYKAPAYIKFDTPMLQELVAQIESTKFDIADNGAVKIPKDLANKKIKINSTTYKIGIGGLHSQEKSLAIESCPLMVMRNADFTSYYPFIILNQELYPKHIGKEFLGVYRSIVETRLRAKAEGNKLVADSLKITINGSFGKFGSKYSKLYSPDLLLATTITGQLSLLMLIEQLEANGIRVISANTDGLEYYCERSKVELAEAIIFDLELVSGYNMEHGEYKALYARDVNNYVAVYDGYTKAKGIYAETTLSKGRSTPIVYTAVRDYLLNGTSLEDTIHKCEDMNEFVSARTVKGGGEYNGVYLGKMVRWYYSSKSKGPITYTSNGNKVPKTDGAYPMMDMTSSLPIDLDHYWYVEEAITALKNLGVDYERTA